MEKRIIKFRAWHEESQEMLKVDEIDFDCTCIIAQTLSLTPVELQFENIELLQFTGLTDKNGVEIYEGDILEIAIPRNYAALSGKTGWITIRAQIEFHGGCFWFGGDGHTDCNWHFYNASDREVIGNIYQNADLLEKGN